METIQRALFASKISALCEEMGVVLRCAAFSPNIRDRLDYSCAVFDPAGALCAQAAHIPVHLGSMAFAMKDLIADFDWQPGDTLVLNDPYLGGTHLPDVTLITPVCAGNQLVAFVANRAHHADIGGDTPGSMPVSSNLAEEGVLLSPQFLVRKGEILNDVWSWIAAQLGDHSTTPADFRAQLAANQRGVARLSGLVESLGVDEFHQGLKQLNDYGEQLARSSYAEIPDGQYPAQVFMDDDGRGESYIPIVLRLGVSGSDIHLDFAGTHEQVRGNINCPLSVAAAAAYYVFRCLLPDYAPACAGIFRPLKLSAPRGCLVNALRPAAVAAGNVETSSRLVDLVMAALREAVPEKMAADSQGTMNNIAVGASGTRRWSYYETIGGGMGAHAQAEGLSGVHSHMTNTLNTPVEVLESTFPLRINRYSLRADSGGSGRHTGGNGLVREYEFLSHSTLTLLTERRTSQPVGMEGGGPGAPGRNLFNDREISAKETRSVSPGDRLCIETPGGGGWGNSDNVQ